MALNCIPAEHCNFRRSYLIIPLTEITAAQPKAETVLFCEDIVLNLKYTRLMPEALEVGSLGLHYIGI